jgi:diguanylate cyclase (GGDEF)-like protein
MNLQEAFKSLQLAVDQLSKAALFDEKTRLGNSVALAEIAALVGTGEGNPDVVVFGDLNRFKALNDRLGHVAGDVAISAVGQLIQDSLVEQCEAKAYRRSGDEFVILLSKNKLDRFKEKVNSFTACQFQFEGATYSVPMSFGYAVSEGEADFQDLLVRAEAACQSAKFQGDGTCVEWSIEIARKALVSFRGRCVECGAQVTVDAPQDALPEDRSMVCPCCAHPLRTI